MEISACLPTRLTENRDASAYLTDIKRVLRSVPGYMYGNGQPFKAILHIFK